MAITIRSIKLLLASMYPIVSQEYQMMELSSEFWSYSIERGRSALCFGDFVPLTGFLVEESSRRWHRPCGPMLKASLLDDADDINLALHQSFAFRAKATCQRQFNGYRLSV